MRFFLIALFIVPAIGLCENKTHSSNRTIDFRKVDWFAQLAALAYKSEADIRLAYPSVQIVATTSRDVQYFLVQDPASQRQIIAVRGTDNLVNARADADYIESKNPKVGIYVHRGFDHDATEIYSALLPNLNKSQELVFTGHSLGAAISTLLMIYAHEDGFKIAQSINFGQPKITNAKGAKHYQFLPLLRVVDENDVVPLVPPDDFIDEIHGGYEHFGSEVLLLSGQYYAFENAHIARRKSIASFWENIGDESVTEHFIANYIANIRSKLKHAQRIEYNGDK